MRIFLTGATGFVGRALAKALAECGFDITAVIRNLALVNESPVSGANDYMVGDLGVNSDWRQSLSDSPCVIHCGGLAHGKQGDLFSVNVEGTLDLARQSAASGVRRFIFISSIGVNGNHNYSAFKECDKPKPVEPYAHSKWHAERGLREVAELTGMEVVIIRPPLVYGPNAPGNFGGLVKWVNRGIPLPFGAIYNKRSLVALDNLVNLIITCIDHPGAANETFLASDGEDLSTTQLLQGVAEAMGKPSRLIPVPAGVLQFGATLLGKKAVAQRLLGSLQVDISHTRKCLNWTPPLTVKQGLQRCFPNQQD